MRDLFEPISRDERQVQCLKNWKVFKGHATCVAATGFGKTRLGTNLITKIINKKPNARIIIVVPTTALKEQWEGIIDSLGFGLNCEVLVINTVVKNHYECDLLICDEIHRFVGDSFGLVFKIIKYKLILGLTATIERLDGKEEYIKKFCPVCDTVTLEDCLANGWLSNYTEYQVILQVDDIDTFKQLNKEFQEHFGFFNFDWDRLNKCVGNDGFKNRAAFRDEMCIGKHVSNEERKAIFRDITYHATSAMRVLQARKAFINNHPKKLEIARKIIAARPNSKIITFSNNVKTAESIGGGKVYTGKDSKKKGRATIEELKSGKLKLIHTCSKANEGLDVEDLSVAIMLGIDSSMIKAIQRVGRVCRRYGDKHAEIFNLIIDGTTELEWFKKSHAKSNYTTIDEQGLNDVLNGITPKPYKKPLKNFTFRY